MIGVKMKKLLEKETKIEKEPSTLMIVFTTILSLVLGLVLIFATEEFFTTLNYIFVIIFAIIGVMQILDFIVNKEYLRYYYSSLIIGMLCLWLALFSYQYYTLFIIILPIILSLYAFIMAIIFIIKYCHNKKIISLLPAILSIIIGICLIFRPVLSVMIYLKITGVYIIIVTIIALVDFLTSKGKNKEK